MWGENRKAILRYAWAPCNHRPAEGDQGWREEVGAAWQGKGPAKEASRSWKRSGKGFGPPHTLPSAQEALSDSGPRALGDKKCAWC